jgi:hypothetical protein
VAKLAAGKLLRARKLRVDTAMVEADIDDPTDADLLEHAVPKLGGRVRAGSRPAVPPAGPGSGTGVGPLAGG